MSYYTLAVSASNHDSSICLLKDNNIVAAYSCERISRKKHTSQIKKHDLSPIKLYTKHVNKLVLVNVWDDQGSTELRVDQAQNLKRSQLLQHSKKYHNIIKNVSEEGITFDDLIVDNDQHHLFHAAAGYYTSGLDQALCIVIDGIGSVYQIQHVLLAETTSFFYAQDTIKTLHKTLLYKHKNPNANTGWPLKRINALKQQYPFPVIVSSHLDIGQMYGTVTRHIGWTPFDAGKTMGLSAYGKQNNLPPMLMDGKSLSNANFFRNDGQIDCVSYPELEHLSNEQKTNLAYNVQKALEVMFVDKVESALRIQYSNNIIIGGGCALNILGNSVLKRKFPDINFYPEPIAADAAQSVGAALHYYKKQFPNAKFKKLDNLYLGPHYNLAITKQRLTHLVERYNESSLPINSN